MGALMARASIDYMNARRALLPAGGGKTYSRETEYCPDRDLDLCERTEMQIASAWSDHRIRQEIMWQQIFERFGYLRAEHVDEIPF
jgi:hypothetical protein